MLEQLDPKEPKDLEVSLELLDLMAVMELLDPLDLKV